MKKFLLTMLVALMSLTGAGAALANDLEGPDARMPDFDESMDEALTVIGDFEVIVVQDYYSVYVYAHNRDNDENIGETHMYLQRKVNGVWKDVDDYGGIPIDPDTNWLFTFDNISVQNAEMRVRVNLWDQNENHYVYFTR
ncbi:hypothetical protein WAK64_20515 [Bacillus spongiae]|uniref:Uncharacterized protein n=1 Tax=Bacillus spongiae TaxID=2683610 RepID=A0ABU8HJ49_9BACI